MGAGSPTKQIPFMSHKGKVVADSNFIIEYIETEFGLDRSEGLQARDVGTSRAFTSMIEQSLAWTIFLHRYHYNYKGYAKIFNTGHPMDGFSESFLERMKTVGIGRKSQTEVYHIAEEDIMAISMLLGENMFLMGEQLTKVDCAVFGHLCQVVYVSYVYPHMEFIQKKCQNLLPYLDRIKEKCWPDWDNIVDKGHFDV